MESVTELVAPFTIETKTTSDITPIIMPNMVRKERILFDKID
jgi:hypothetical protein